MEKNTNRTFYSQEFDNWMREFYNKKAKETTKGNYEYYRWFSSKRKRRQYRHTVKSLLFHLRNIEFKNCLEIGCGPGTWTKLLLRKYPDTKFTCLDISKEMIAQFKKAVKSKNKNQIKTKVINFLDYDSKEKYDFIFFSRAIEYIPNKARVIEKLYDLMENRGKCILITSPPHPFILSLKKLSGKKVNVQHTQRISVKHLAHLLRKQGFKKIRFYPILFADYLFVPNTFLFNLLYRKRFGMLSKMFASSYLAKFEKP